MTPPTMKQWRQLVLAGMLAWLLLFLALLSHFLDPRAMVPRSRATSSLTHPETRRLASIQGSQREIRASPPETSLSFSSFPPPVNQDSSWGDQTQGGPTRHSWEETQEGDPRVDPQALAVWSNFRDGVDGGIGIVRDPTRTRDSGVWSEVSEEEDWEERRRRRKRRTRKQRRRRGKRWSMAGSERAKEDPGEDYYFSKSKAVVQRLWRGNASAGMLSPRLQKAMKDYLSANKHQVAYRGRRRSEQSGLEVLCELKRQARVSTLDGTEPPFAEMGWAKMVPPRPLEELHGSQFKTCAVVTSAGAILNSSLGREIDSHEAVLRFNAAPTEGYENDVGNKTTIRIINSQILARPKHRFNTNSLYKDVTLVAWDPAPYSVDLPRWYRSPDYDLFTPYIERRRLQPSQPFYILHPKFIWQLWDVIQGNTQESIQPNPPSSGFIGILLMMELCQEVHVYEYIPSLRQTDLCHYHERYYDAACTLGAYHPLLYEKMLVQRMNMASEQDLSRKGKVTLPGFSAIDCGP